MCTILTVRCTCTYHSRLLYALFKVIGLCLLYFYEQKIVQLRERGDQLCVLRTTAALNLVSLDCSDVNEILIKRAYSLADRVVTFLINDNRELNRE